MNKRRLLKLADFLETVPRRSLNMSMFGFGAEKPFTGEFDCGFAGCAMGWAGHSRMFRELRYDGRRFTINGRRVDPFVAARRAFDLNSIHLAYDLFGANPGTPKQVAKRIRKFVASNGAMP